MIVSRRKLMLIRRGRRRKLFSAVRRERAVERERERKGKNIVALLLLKNLIRQEGNVNSKLKYT